MQDIVHILALQAEVSLFGRYMVSIILGPEALLRRGPFGAGPEIKGIAFGQFMRFPGNDFSDYLSVVTGDDVKVGGGRGEKIDVQYPVEHSGDRLVPQVMD